MQQPQPPYNLSPTGQNAMALQNQPMQMPPVQMMPQMGAPVDPYGAQMMQMGGQPMQMGGPPMMMGSPPMMMGGPPMMMGGPQVIPIDPYGGAYQQGMPPGGGYQMPEVMMLNPDGTMTPLNQQGQPQGAPVGPPPGPPPAAPPAAPPGGAKAAKGPKSGK